MRTIVSVFFAVIIIFGSLDSASGQSGNTKKGSSRPNSLIGTWELIVFVNSDSLGNWVYPFGTHPRGFVTYTRSNIFNINMSSEIPMAISEEESRTKSITLDEFLWKYSFGYFGTYNVDFKRSVVTHEVRGGTIPWFVGTDQQRPFILKGDTLIIGDNKAWKRVLVKAD